MPDKSTLQFLKGLEKNNNKSWFDTHRDEYNTIREDFLEFTTHLITETSKFDSSVAELDPKKCLLRMNRDARFTKNKPPYHHAFRVGLSKADKKNWPLLITLIMNQVTCLWVADW